MRIDRSFRKYVQLDTMSDTLPLFRKLCFPDKLADMTLGSSQLQHKFELFLDKQSDILRCPGMLFDK